MRERAMVFLSLFLLILSAVQPVSAHASLVDSNPPANTSLNSSPAEIRLFFSEQVDPAFSKFTLRDINGSVVTTPASQVDSNDAKQMFMNPATLPNGLYTVVWRCISAADGHETEGSFPFAIGIQVEAALSVASGPETVPVQDAAIRWLNFLSLSLVLGGLSFWLFVWKPSVSEGHPSVERRMRFVLWAGWMLMGVATFLLLFMQASHAVDKSIGEAAGDLATLGKIIYASSYGRLWLVRLVCWLLLSVSLEEVGQKRSANLLSLGLGFGVLMTTTLFSHATAAQDSLAAVISDAFHLFATTLWVGGLVQFINVLGGVRRYYKPSAEVTKVLVAYFTNFARLAVATLFITGLYAAWLEVGSVEALLTTLYGQLLFVKLVLIVPLLGIAGINLIFTSRGLEAGREIWVGVLRGLVGAEIALTLGIFAAVGSMTSIAPGRGVLEARAAQPQPPQPQPIVTTNTVQGTNVKLEITPGWTGQNTFNLTLTDASGSPINDASLIRMRFTSLTQDMGESEIRPTRVGDGVYSIDGSNLSIPGNWRIRVTIARPDKFDTLADFKPTMSLPPAPAPAQAVETGIPVLQRVLALLVPGIAALLVGGFFLANKPLRLGRLAGILASSLLVMGGIYMTSILLVMTLKSTA